MMNPMFWLDLRIRAREKRLWIIALFFIAALFVITGVVMASSLISCEFRQIEPCSIGSGLTWATLFCQAGLLIILAPLATAGRISQEREQRTLPGLINSPLSALRITLGKLFGSWTFVLWLAALALPFLFVSTLWGGPSWRVILACFFINLYAGLVLSAISLGISGLFVRSLTAYLVTGSVLFGWMAIVPMLGTLATVLNHNASPLYKTVISYLAFFHNPFYPLIVVTSEQWRMQGTEIALQLAYCFFVWFVFAAFSLRLAVRSFRREVY